jgi:hypothetical protein
MKSLLECLRELNGMEEAKQIPYLLGHGAAIITNTLVFPNIPNSGATMNTATMLLLTKLSVKGTASGGQLAYDTQKGIVEGMMEANYDYVDLIAQGSEIIINKAGIKATSSNTTRTAAPPKAEGVAYIMSEYPGEIGLKFNAEKLALAGIIISSINEGIVVTLSATNQIKIAMASFEIYIDVVTGHKTIIKNQTGGTSINSTVALFNPNGFSPLASPPSKFIPE